MWLDEERLEIVIEDVKANFIPQITILMRIMFKISFFDMILNVNYQILKIM